MNALVGAWVFVAVIYHGELMPKPNPNLNITFEFNADQTNRLYYDRTGDVGFCERKATYSYADNVLTQKNTWINPENQPSCDTDPDMKLNSESVTKAVVNEQQMYLDLPLGDETLTYIWQKK
ncbi:MAG: lipocalin family protein [Bdellovibrio sp.]|nr:lipocalin family protein [Bdellovibrio sp.]